MTLENMREIGERTIEATCECGDRAIVNISGLPGAIEAPALRHRLRRLAPSGGWIHTAMGPRLHTLPLENTASMSIHSLQLKLPDVTPSALVHAEAN